MVTGTFLEGSPGAAKRSPLGSTNTLRRQPEDLFGLMKAVDRVKADQRRCEPIAKPTDQSAGDE
jgi:hypothetical protein